jgi:hypothetical protein
MGSVCLRAFRIEMNRRLTLKGAMLRSEAEPGALGMVMS